MALYCNAQSAIVIIIRQSVAERRQSHTLRAAQLVPLRFFMQRVLSIELYVGGTFVMDFIPMLAIELAINSRYHSYKQNLVLIICTRLPWHCL